MAMPLPLSRSCLAWGRSGLSSQIIGCSGAEGSLSCWGIPLNDFHAEIISSLEGLLSNLAETQAVWPSMTGTLLQCADIAKPLAGTISLPLMLPRIFSGSHAALYSSHFSKWLMIY